MCLLQCRLLRGRRLAGWARSSAERSVERCTSREWSRVKLQAHRSPEGGGEGRGRCGTAALSERRSRSHAAHTPPGCMPPHPRVACQSSTAPARPSRLREGHNNRPQRAAPDPQASRRPGGSPRTRSRWQRRRHGLPLLAIRARAGSSARHLRGTRASPSQDLPRSLAARKMRIPRGARAHLPRRSRPQPSEGIRAQSSLLGMCTPARHTRSDNLELKRPRLTPHTRCMRRACASTCMYGMCVLS